MCCLLMQELLLPVLITFLQQVQLTSHYNTKAFCGEVRALHSHTPSTFR